MSSRILIVEDDPAIATGLSLNLRLAGHAPTVVTDGDQAIAAIAASPPDLVLLDMNLPKKNGLEVISAVRDSGVHVPIIIVSARDGEFDKVGALRLGADDYVTKPFALAELMARIDAVLRRTALTRAAAIPVETSNKLRFADIEVDTATRTTYRGEEEIKLTHLEFELLEYLLRHPNQVFSRADLLQEVWGQSNGTLRTVDNFVGQLRAKLERDPNAPSHFVTVRGAGYRFDPSPG